MDKNTVSITLWGDGLIKKGWSAWYDDIGEIMLELGYERTHIGIQSTSYTNPKIVTVERKERDILKLLHDGECPMSLSCYSLPRDYKIASFDYNILAVRQSSYISLIINNYDFEKVNVDEVTRRLKRYIDLVYGEVYQMDRAEMPLLYAAKANSPKAFKSLKVITKYIYN